MEPSIKNSVAEYDIVLVDTETNTHWYEHEYFVKYDQRIVGGFNLLIEFDHKNQLHIKNFYISRLIDYQLIFGHIINFLNRNFTVANYIFDPIIHYGYIMSYFTFPEKWRSIDFCLGLEDDLSSMLSGFRIDPIGLNNESLFDLEFKYKSGHKAHLYIEEPNHAYIENTPELKLDYLSDSESSCSSNEEEMTDKKVIYTLVKDHNENPLVWHTILSPQYIENIYDKNVYKKIIEFMKDISTCYTYSYEYIQAFVISKAYIPKNKLKVRDTEIEITLYYKNISISKRDIVRILESESETALESQVYRSDFVKITRKFQLIRKKLQQPDTKKYYNIIGILFDEPIKIICPESLLSEDIELTLRIGHKFYTNETPCFEYRFNKLWRGCPDDINPTTHTYIYNTSSLVIMDIAGFFTPETDEDYCKSLSTWSYEHIAGHVKKSRDRGIERGFYDYPQLIDMMNSIHKDFQGFSKTKIPEYIYTDYVIPKSLIPKQEPIPKQQASSSSTDQPTQDLGYIYILHEREFINSNQPIYTIGRSGDAKIRADSMPSRSGGYPKHSRYLYLHDVGVDNSRNLETIIKRVLAQKFKLRSDIGSEYFEGDKYKIIECVSKICNGLPID